MLKITYVKVYGFVTDDYYNSLQEFQVHCLFFKRGRRIISDIRQTVCVKYTFVLKY